MEKWEYKTEIITASIDNKGVKEVLAIKYPELNPNKYSPETMEPYLDSLGSDGWELVSMQPIQGQGSNSDVAFADAQIWHYSHVYFCAFKRRKIE